MLTLKILHRAQALTQKSAAGVVFHYESIAKFTKSKSIKKVELGIGLEAKSCSSYKEMHS